MSKLLKQSQTAQPLLFLMVSSTDHISGATGLTPTVTLSKNGGAFASPSGAVTELANGWYTIAGNATDTGTLGPLLIHASATGADPCDERYEVVAFDPQSATNLGLTNLDATVSSRSTFSGGAVASVTAPVTVGTNNDKTGYTASTVSDKTGYSLASTQTFNVTGNITGNLSGSVASVTGAVGSVTGSVGSIATGGIAATSFATDAIGAAAVSAAAVTKIQAGLSTYAGGDTSGTTTLLARLTGTRAANLDNLDASVGSRLATSGYTAPTTPPTVVQIRQEMDANSTKLANLDAAISTRSTYAGTDTSGTTTLLSRLTSQRAANLDNLDAAVSTVATGGISAADIADAVYAKVAVNTTTYGEILVTMAAILAGNLTESSDHTTSAFADINDPATPRTTSVNTATTRTVTVL